VEAEATDYEQKTDKGNQKATKEDRGCIAAKDAKVDDFGRIYLRPHERRCASYQKIGTTIAMAGKGDTPRKVDGDKYRANYDSIFKRHDKEQQDQQPAKPEASESQKN
jgi:hypothetical protein